MVLTSALVRLEAAQTALSNLLDDPAVPEDRYQDWFEEHTVVFEVLGYEQAIPQPHLFRKGQDDLIPDFLCRRPSGLWEIFELKRPSEKIVISPDHRPQLYAPITRYVAQCQDYKGYFQDSVNRLSVKERHDIDVQKDVPAVLVVGRLRKDDPNKIVLANPSHPDVTIYTYDELAMDLELLRTRLVDHGEDSSGYSVQLVLSIREMEDDENVILDMAVGRDRDRLTLFVSPAGDLKLRLLDHDRTEYTVSSAFDDLGIQYEQIVLLGMQVGFGAKSSVVTLEVDGVTRATRVFDPMRLDMDADSNIWGSDVDQGVGSFRLYAHAMWFEVLGLADRRSLYDEFNVEEKRAMVAAGSLPSHFDIVPGTCIVSSNHPFMSDVRCRAPRRVR